MTGGKTLIINKVQRLYVLVLTNPQKSVFMKKIKFSFGIIAMLFIAGVSQLNAQVTREIIYDWVISSNVRCANDGQGEHVDGVIRMLSILQPDGSGHLQPMGGYAVGSETGIIYRVVGGTTGIFTVNNQNGTFTLNNRFHLVGKGTVLMVNTHIHAVTLPDGSLKFTVDDFEFICK